MKKHKAQHIIEFAILFPFLVALFVICMQFGYTLSLNFKFANIMNQTVNKVAFTHPTSAQIETLAKANLALSKFPHADSVFVDIVHVNDMDVIIGQYRYKTYMDLAHAVFESMPEEFVSNVIIPVNEAILRDNTYNTTQDEMDGFISDLNTLNTQIYNELHP